MLEQKKSFAESLAEARAKAVENPLPEIYKKTSPVPIVVTSESQVNKANQGASVDFYKTLFAQNDEHKALIEMEKAKVREQKKYETTPGSLLDTHKTILQDEEKYKTFVKEGEQLEGLRDKSTFNRLKSSIIQAGVTTPGSIASAIVGLFTDEKDVLKAFISPTLSDNKRTKQEDIEFKNLSEKRDRELRPAAILHAKKIEEQNAVWKESVDELQAQRQLILDKRKESLLGLDEEGKPLPTSEGYGDMRTYTPDPTEQKELTKLNDQLYLLNMAKMQNEDALKLVTDFVEGKSTLWDGLFNHGTDIATIGVKTLVTNLQVANVAEKLDKLVDLNKGDEKIAWEALNEGERAVMTAFNKKQEVQALELQKDNWWYHNANGVGQSLVFMGGMMLTGGVNTMAEAGTKALTRGLTKKMIGGTIKKSLKRKLGIAISENFIPKSAGLVAQGLASPSTYSGMARKYTGNTKLITDEDGTQRIVVRKGAYTQFMREYEDNKRMLNELYTVAVQNGNEEDIAKYAEQMQKLNEEKGLLLDQSELGKGTAFAYGLTETMKEAASELYVGQVGEYGSKLFSKSSWGKWLVGSKVAKGSKWLGEKYKAGGSMIANTSVGKITSKAMYHTGANKLYHGIWGEMAEEIVVQATPTLTENYLEQLQELANPSFYADVTAQTVIMSGGITTLGLANQILNYKKHKGLYDSRQAIREAYKKLDKAVTDEDLAETIVMATAGTGFSMAEYNHKVNTLRAEGKMAEANRMEEKKFYNMALKAIQTNTLDEFEKSLSKAKENAESVETANNIEAAKRDLAELKKTYEKYQGKSNIGNIIELASQKITNKKSIQHLDEEMANQRSLANEEIESLIAREKIPFDFISIEELLEREITDDEAGRQTTKLIEKLEEENTPAIGTYFDLLFAKDNLQYAQHQTMKAFNDQVSPAYEAKTERVKSIDRQLEKIISFIETNPYAEGGHQINPVTGKLIPTESFIDKAFLGIDTMGLTKKEVDAVKDQYKNQIKRQTQGNEVQSIEDIFALYEEKHKSATSQTNPVVANVNTEIEQVIEKSPLETQEKEKPFIEDSSIFAITQAGRSISLAEMDKVYDGTFGSIEKAFNVGMTEALRLKVKYEEEVFKPEFEEIEIESKESIPAILTQEATSKIEEAITGKTESVEQEPLFPTGDLSEQGITDPNVDFSLSPLSTEDFGEEQLNKIQAAMKGMYEGVKEQIHREPTFKELLSHFIKYQGKEKAESFFDAYRIGWERNNYEPTNYQEVYNEIFEPLKSTVDAMTTLLESLYGVAPIQKEMTPQELRKEIAEEEEKKEEEESSVTNFTEDNIPVKSLHGNRVDSPALRLGFNAIEYKEVKQPDGTYIRVSVLTNSLNENDTVIDFRDLLDPDKYNVGDSLTVGVAPKEMWGEIHIAVGRNENNQVITKSFAEIIEEKKKENPDFESSQEFKDIVPMFAYGNNAKPLAHIHEVGWYNQWNVSDPANPKGGINPISIGKAHAEAIQEAKLAISSFRSSVHAGEVSKVKIKTKVEGPFYTIENEEDEQGNLIPLLSINEANPQAIMAVQIGAAGTLETQSGVPFNKDANGDELNRKLINQEQILEKGGNGHTWNIRRIGTDPKDGKETWRALKVIRYPTEDQLETLRWAWSAYSYFDTADSFQNGKKVKVIQDVRKFIPKQYQMSEQQSKAMVKEVEAITGYNLMRFDDAMKFFALFVQPRGGKTNAQYGRTIYTEPLHKFSQHTSLEGMTNNPRVATIDKQGKVTDTGKSYSEALKDTLQTGVKSFNIGTAENPKYVTSIQPTITFEYETSKSEVSTQETVILDLEKTKKASIEALEELTGQQSAETLIAEAKSLIAELGFNFNYPSLSPSQLQGTSALESIFSITPGLTIGQESNLVNYVYNFVLASIDIKYKSKASAADILKELKNSYNEVILPSKARVEKILSQLQETQKVAPSSDIAAAIAGLERVNTTLSNIEDNWDKETIKENLAAIGEEYTGQKGIVEKALEEVYKTSDIKEAKEDSDELSDELSDEEDISIREKSFSENANLTEDGKGKITYRLRRFMSGIKKKDVTGNDVKSFLGLPDYMNFNEVYDNIYQLLGDGVYIESDYQAMRTKIMELEDTKPWVKELMERFDKADVQLRKEFVYNYRKHAVNMKFAMYSTGTQGTTLQVFDTNANEITRVIATQWKDNIKTTPLSKIIDGHYVIDREKAKQLLEEYNSWGTEGHLQSDSTVKAWLANFGLDLSDGYFEELKTEGFKSKGKIIAYPLIFKGNTPIGLLAKYLVRMETEQNLDFEDNTKAHPLKDMNDIIKAMAKGESKYTAKMISKSFRDAGKNISGITHPTYLTDKIDDLKRAALSRDKDGFLAKIKQISMTSNSVMLELFEKDPNFASKVEANYLGITALKELGSKSNNFSSITDLNSMDHDITKLTMFQNRNQGEVSHKINNIPMRIARMFLPTMSDKSQMLTIASGVFDFMKASDLFEINNEGQTVFEPALRELLYNRLILPEMKRISKFHQNGGKTNVKDYDESAQIFNFFPALNNVKDENGTRIIKHLAVMPLEEVEKYYKEQLTDSVEQIMHSLVAKKMENWESGVERNKEGGIKSISIFDGEYLAQGRGTLDEKFKVATYDFVLNSVLSNADMFTLLAGDPAIFGQSKNFKGQNVSPHSNVDDKFYTQKAKKQGVNIGKRLALLIAPGATLADSKGKTYKQIYLKDAPQMSENIEYLISLYYGKEALAEPLLGTTTVKESLEDYRTTKDNSKRAVIKKALEAKFKDISSYFELDSTDAQEYSTIKEHTGTLLDQGRLSQEEYDYIMNKVALGEELKKEDPLFAKVMQPIKPVYTGQTLDVDQDLARTSYIKSSSFPLLPQLTAGLKLDVLRVAMEEVEAKYGEGVRASYQTANKVGALSDDRTIDPLNTESLKNIEGSMLTLEKKNFRIQQDVPFKSDKKKKDEIAMGTQIFKLLFGDGVLNLGGFKLDPADENTVSGSKLYEQYSDTMFKLIDVKTQELYKELGLSKEGKVTDPEVSTKKLQDLLQKEAIKRDYPIKDIKGLEIEALEDTQGNTYYEFKLPLWLSSNSNRYESLLNAIVTNRILKHKLPGNSFVVGSENGFSFKEDLGGIDKSRIIYLNGWNGVELQGVKATDGTFARAQVLMPSKFKGTDGKLIDLFQTNEEGDYIYLEKTERGTWTLREGMIDPELLNSFSFRTPTSSHVSASTIDIVGFLPPECGDLMVVPKNFTAQKGLDYDVDKENAYQYHHIVNFRTKKIEILTDNHKERATRRLKELLEDLDLQKEKIKRITVSEYVAELAQGEDGNLLEMIDDTAIAILSDEFKTKEEKYDAIVNEYDIKLLENKLIRIHNAVFSNPEAEMQKKINKVLSMDFARYQADLIQEWTEIGVQQGVADTIRRESDVTEEEAKALATSSSNDFTILSDEYQKEKMGLGSTGKMAIGVYSNYVTFHSLVQQTGRTIRLKEETEEGIYEDKTITIGNVQSDGRLGLQDSLTAKGYKGTVRSISEAFAERQNTATDNEKEQILGRVNITSETIGVDSLLLALGFDMDEKGNSVSYTLLSQPILKQYIKALQDARGVTSEYEKDLKSKVINQLLSSYSEGAYSYADGAIILNDKHDKAEAYSRVDLNSILTANALEEGIKSQGKSANQGLVQVATLAKFLELDHYAKKIGKAQALLNTKSLGKSIIESNAAYARLETIGDEKEVENVTSLIGDFRPINEVSTRPEGYIVVGDYYVKPTTPQGKIVITGLTTGQELWSQYFPYNDPYIKSIMEAILKAGNIDASSTFKVIETQQEIIEEMKKFIFSWKGLGIFNEVASKERERLFIDTTTNTSLANYLNKNSRHSSLVSNKLLNTFTYEVETTGSPSIIKYNNTISNNLDEKYLYNSLAELIIEDKPLPDKDGKPFSTRQLAQELITYTYVEGGIQEAIQFIKYVPIEYLSEVGIQAGEEFVSANTLLQRVSNSRNPLVFKNLLGVNEKAPMKSVFVKQYFQHNPNKAKKYNKEQVAKFTFDEKGNFNSGIDPAEAPQFIAINQKTKSKLKQDKHKLFEHIGGGMYQQISILGAHGMNEYELGNQNATSLISKKAIAPIDDNNSTGLNPAPNLDLSIVKTGKSARQIVQDITNSRDPKFERLKLVARILLPMVDDKVKVEVADMAAKYDLHASGAYYSDTHTIVVDTKAKNKEKTFLHELVHSISKRELEKYYSQDANGFYTMLRSDAPAHVQSLNEVWKEFMNTVSPALKQSAINKTKRAHAGEVVIWTQEEQELGYASVDIFEFLALGLESAYFQNEMSKITYSETKTLKERFMEVIHSILKVLNPEIEEGTLAEASLTEILNFLSEEHKIREENVIFAEVETELFEIKDVDMSAISDQLAQEEWEKYGDMDSDSGTQDTGGVSLSPQNINPFNQNC